MKEDQIVKMALTSQEWRILFRRTIELIDRSEIAFGMSPISEDWTDGDRQYVIVLDVLEALEREMKKKGGFETEQGYHIALEVQIVRGETSSEFSKSFFVWRDDGIELDRMDLVALLG